MTDNTVEVRAIRIEQFGGPEVLQVQKITLPPPGPGQARVRIHAAGLNFIDIYRRRGDYPTELPTTPGLEASGVVEAIAADVTEVKVGDRVAYTGQPGAYAEAAIVDAAKLVPLPESMSFAEGAAFPLQGMTAHYLINEYKKPKPNMTVLIHAAAGGMGLLLCQWAKHLGAQVIGTVSTAEKAKLATEAGCDHVINYSSQDFVTEVKRITADSGAELIIDGVGKDTFPGDLEAVALRGTVVIFGSASGRAEPVSPNLFQQKSVSVCGGTLFNYLLDRDELLMRANDVTSAIREGWLKLSVYKEFPLEDAAKAHEMLESRKSTGKIVLTMNN
ncbi:MAG: quinone oxidoreductase [Candidatus Melainabacteria bacterium]|nr:quinone oxidoreductase [Candidatus Melainabacteria bacterium]